MFDRAGIDIAPIQKVVTPISKVLESARHAGLKVVYLKMGFRPDPSDLGRILPTGRIGKCFE